MKPYGKPQVLEFCLQKLVEQGTYSALTSGNKCLYNGPNNTHCFVGMLLDPAGPAPPEVGVEELPTYILSNLQRTTGLGLDDLVELQAFHDRLSVSCAPIEIGNLRARARRKFGADWFEEVQS